MLICLGALSAGRLRICVSLFPIVPVMRLNKNWHQIDVSVTEKLSRIRSWLTSQQIRWHTNFEKCLVFSWCFFLVTINELGIWAQPLYKLLAQNLPGKGYYGALFQFNQREESWGRGSHKSRFWQESNSVVRDGWILIYFWHVYAFSSVHNFNHSTRSEGGSAANTNKCL